MARFNIVDINRAFKEITDKQRDIKYDTKDYTLEVLVNKFNSNELYQPEYQRNYRWGSKNKSLFIESLLLGYPIPFMFFAELSDGKLEIVDGVQRTNTLSSFINNQFALSNLEKLTSLNRFKFEDLPTQIQRRLKNTTIRVVVLFESTSTDAKQDIFKRINTRGEELKPAEVNRGSFPGVFTKFIEDCSKNPLFIKLAPLSRNKISKREDFELVSRFFAYSNGYLDFKGNVQEFVSNYIYTNKDNESIIPQLEEDFIKMLEFVEKYFPNGFSVGHSNGRYRNDVPRTRFEAISIGVHLALKEQDIVEPNMEWLNSSEFKRHTVTDAANNVNKFINRIEYVKQMLLKKD